MKVLVTGGAGFIGSHIVELYMKRGCEVSVIDNLTTGTIKNLRPYLDNPNFRLYSDNIVDCEDLTESIKKADVVFHMAAVVGVKHVLENPINVLSSNISSTDKLLSTMAKHGAQAPVVIASSSEVYGFNSKKKFSEEDMLYIPSKDQLRWCYAVTKLADEMLAFACNYQTGIKTISVRLFNTVGRRQLSQYGMVLPHFVQQALSGEDITVYGTGDQTRSFCDVRDTVAMLDELAQTEEAYGKVVNVGNDSEIAIKDLALKVKEITQSSSGIVHKEYKDAYGMQFEDIKHRCPSLKELYNLIKYRPKLSIDETIRDIVALIKEKGN